MKLTPDSMVIDGCLSRRRDRVENVGVRVTP